MPTFHRITLGLWLFCLSPWTLSKIYLTPPDFLKAAFRSQGDIPHHIFWINNKQKQQITQILGHPYVKLRIRYWQQGARTAWILEEIGKTEPITTGIVVEHQKIILLTILAFRESRGSEVRHPFFTQQFKQLSLTPDYQLSKTVDGITGATLSVHAVEKTAKVALFLTSQLPASPAGP